MVQGRGINSSLNATGKRQSQQVFKALQHVEIDSFHTSELVRTQETIQPFNSDFVSHSGFDEISWGTQEGTVPSIAAKDSYWNTVEDWRNGQLDKSVGGGESPIEVHKRQKTSMDLVLANSQVSLICMHGRAMRILLCWLLNYPLEFMDGFEHHNCCYYKLKFSNGVFRVDEFNQKAHLKL